MIAQRALPGDGGRVWWVLLDGDQDETAIADAWLKVIAPVPSALAQALADLQVDEMPAWLTDLDTFDALQARYWWEVARARVEATNEALAQYARHHERATSDRQSDPTPRVGMSQS